MIPWAVLAVLLTPVVVVVGQAFWTRARTLRLPEAEGPRMGSFFALYGRAKSIRLIEDALAGRLADTTSTVRES